MWQVRDQSAAAYSNRAIVGSARSRSLEWHVCSGGMARFASASGTDVGFGRRDHRQVAYGQSSFEAEYLAAIGLVGYMIGYLPGIFAIPSIAATALVARMIGATDEAGARRRAQSLIVE